MTPQTHRLLWLALQLALATAGLAAFAMNGDWATGIGVFVGVALTVLVFEIARRRGVGAVGALTGVGDERARGIYRQVNAGTGEIFSYVLAGWALWTVARGAENETLLTVVAVYAGLWFANAVRVGWASRQPRAQSATDRVR